MSTQTQYYNLEKPEGTDLIMPDPFNDNMDTIDSELHTHSLALSNLNPWVELVNFEETINLSSGADSFFYRNFSDLTKPINYYDKLFIMFYFNGTSTNPNTSDSNTITFSPRLCTNGTITTSRMLYYDKKVSKSSSSTFTIKKRVESFIGDASAGSGVFGELGNANVPDEQTRYWFQWGWTGSITSDSVKVPPTMTELTWDSDNNGFGISVGQTGTLSTIGTLKCKLFGQRTYGDMRW